MRERREIAVEIGTQSNENVCVACNVCVTNRNCVDGNLNALQVLIPVKTFPNCYSSDYLRVFRRLSTSSSSSSYFLLMVVAVCGRVPTIRAHSNTFMRCSSLVIVLMNV